ncbi:MAG: hypothetical protein OEV08_13875 [Nitrospira sp.]|nr:hypothetical protein [Nitrospira sp.]
MRQTRGPALRLSGARFLVIMGLGWAVMQLNYDSSAEIPVPTGTQRAVPALVTPPHALPPASLPEPAGTAGSDPSAKPTPIQGPALTVPEEVVAMLQQRQEEVERRERAVRVSEERLAALKVEIEQILIKVEAAEQRRLQLKEQQEKAAAEKRTAQTIAKTKQEDELQDKNMAHLTKIYESMPAEDAAARIERMSDRKALQILRLVKGKTAGLILAQVKVSRAAKLTEQLLAKP